MIETEKLINDSFISKLKALGLSTYAAKVYLALLSNPNSSATFLCNETGIPDSKMYYTLKELHKIGMIDVREGSPNTYNPLHPKMAISHLKQELLENYSHKVKEADTLIASISPIFENAENQEDMEVAYVINGQKNILRRIIHLMSNSNDEILIIISSNNLFQTLLPVLNNLKSKITVKFAGSIEICENSDLFQINNLKISTCSCNIVLTDKNTLITVSSWENGIAILTNDKGLVSMCHEFYENHLCQLV
ncbi:MAG: TrmB family transcriptional regulator [Candidatus Heimdallarchaeota archaeon]|nr:TrmB family transcriptional regulator [Candidatus Heimdallarchaeota archaeon]